MRLWFFLLISFSFANANAHIFVYHRFDDIRYPSTNTSSAQLRAQFEYLKKNNYEVVALDKIVNSIDKNQQIPNNWVAFTIDDSYKSFYKNGLAVFREYKFPFTIFVSTEVTQAKYPDFMNWVELNDVLKYGDVQFHSHKHPHLTHLTDAQIIEDTKKGIEIFKSNMGFEPKYYAYPYGEYDNRVKLILSSQFKLKSLFNQAPGSVTQHSDKFDIFRFPLVGESNIKEQLKYSALNHIEWFSPKNYPKDGVLREVEAKVPNGVKNLKLFVSGDNKWRDIEVVNGIAKLKLNIKLTKDRTRVVLGSGYYQTSTKLLVK